MRTRLFACIALIILGAAAVVYSGTTGIISGTVTDSATGEKLAGVNVIVEGTNLTTVTDQNGYYVITNVPPGDYKVTTSLIGYADAEVRKVSVLMDITATVEVAMNQAVAQEEQVVVTEARPMIQRDVIPTTYIMDHAQERMVRGQALMVYQTPGLVITQPGIVADEQGYPHVRGGRANEIGYMLDGIPITEPVTNGFGTNIVTVGLDKMEMFTGGYRPEYGNAISGIFNQVIKTGRTAPGGSLELVGGAQAFRGAYPEIGGSAANGMDYYVGGYISHTDLKDMDYNEGDSYDLIGKFNYPAGTNNKLTLLVGNGWAKYQFPSTHTQTYGAGGIQATDPTRDFNGQVYQITALTFSHNINSSSFFTVRPYYFRNAWKFDGLSDDKGMWWDAASATTGLQFDYTNQLSPSHLLKTGAIRMAGSNRYWAKVPALDAYGMGTYEYTADTDTAQTGLYAQDQMRLGRRWWAEAGLRYDRMNYDKVTNPDATESQTSPRFGVSYTIDPRTNLRASYGKMIQFVHSQAIERNYVEPDSIWALTYYGSGTGNLLPERSTQFDVGWERQVNSDYSLQVTPFYRKYTDMLQTTLLDPSDPVNSPVVYDNLGVGNSKGIEFLVKKRAGNNWTGWLAYTYSMAQAESSDARAMIEPGVMNYVDWDQRHTAVLVLNYAKSDWNYSIMGAYGSGLPYNLSGEDPNSRRSPSNAVVNLNIARNVKGGWLPVGQMTFSVGNLFNSHTVLDRSEDGEPTAHVAPRFISMSYTRRF